MTKKILIIVLLTILPFGLMASDGGVAEAHQDAIDANLLIPIVPDYYQNFAVSAANPHAVQAGFDILKKGGSAVDAAIATQMVLNVVEPQSSGIGGGGFMMFYDNEAGDVKSYDGRETAPKNVENDIFLDLKGEPIPFFDAVKGGHSVGTPGLLKMFAMAHDKYGELEWEELFEPAIRIAEDGFGMSARLNSIASKVTYLREFPRTKSLYIDGKDSVREVGSIIKNPELAATFRIIAEKGVEAFYEGEIAENIVSAVQNAEFNPSVMTLDDLKNYDAVERENICGSYRKYKICSFAPPSSGGITLLQMLGVLEEFELNKMSPKSAKSAHIISEASRLAFADRNHYLADSDFVDVPIRSLLDEGYLKRRAELIDENKAAENVQAGVFEEKLARANDDTEKPSTTHISVVDADGNAVSMTTSIEYAFGSALSVRGFLLNNEMTDFSFRPEIEGVKVANAIEGGKRPRSSMTPTLVFDENDNLYMVIGSPGGSRIIGYVLQTIIGVLDWNMSMQEAIDMPKIIHRGKFLELEEGTAQAYNEEALKLLGHDVKVTELNSGLHGMVIDIRGISGGADKRREGIVMGE